MKATSWGDCLLQGFDAKTKRGIATAIGCYVLWGLLPLFWKFLSAVSSFEVLANRMFWCLICVLLFCSVIRKTKFTHLFKDRRAVKTFLCSGALVTVNWGVYIWAVNSGNVAESALGYYINPLVSILFGLLFFHERLSKAQIIAFVLAIFGVGFLTVNYGRFPWIALTLALSFGAYGAVKKRGGYPSVPGMAVESTFTGLLGLALMVVGFFIPGIWEVTPVTSISPFAAYAPWLVAALLVLSGLATFLPLQLFAEAANSIPLVLLGFIQYLSPTIALAMAVFVFGEPFTLAHAVCFACIWTGIACIIIETLYTARKNKNQS